MLTQKEKIKLYNKEYCLKYKEKLKEKRKQYKERARANNYKYNYGITIEQYNIMFEAQKGCCSICKQHQSALKRKLFIDHCHTTNKIRGLLCDNCNKGLGHFKDSILFMNLAIDYLNKGD